MDELLTCERSLIKVGAPKSRIAPTAAQLVVGKPRSSWLVEGSGQRVVTTLGRV
jgi:hypothetical protein